MQLDPRPAVMSHRGDVVCATCGTNNPEHLTFCQECGKRLAPPLAASLVSRRCHVCGHENTPEVRFCVACGTTLGQPASPVVGAPLQSAAPAPKAASAPAIEAAQPAKGAIVCDRCRGASDAGSVFCRYCGATLGAPAAVPPVQMAPTTPEVRSAMLAAAAGTARNSIAASIQPRGKVLSITREGKVGSSAPLFDVLDIGRSAGDIVVTDDAYLSDRHVRLVFRGEKLFLCDLASVNGVYVRLPPLARPESAEKSAEGDSLGSRVPLADQDLILLGQQVLRFEIVQERDAGLGPAMQHGTLLFGTPAAPKYARLCQKSVEGVTRDIFHVGKVETVLGRESGDVVFTEDPFLSRRHAMITMTPRLDPGSAPRFELIDLNSSNGTFLKIRREVEVVHGTQFRAGQQLFRIDLDARNQSVHA